MRRFVLVLAGLVTLAVLGSRMVPARAPASLPGDEKSVVDMHAHVAGLGRGCDGCFVAAAGPGSLRLDYYLASFGTSVKEMNEHGDTILIEHLLAEVRTSRWVARMVLLALDGVVDGAGELDRAATQMYVPNRWVAELATTHEEFLFGASINPHRRDALTLLDDAAREGAVLVKWIPAVMAIDPADPALDPFYDRLVALGLPLLVHVGDQNAFAHADNALGDPVRLVRPLARGVTVIAAHFGTTGETDGEENFTRLLDLLPRYPRLYADISSLTQINKRRYLGRALGRSGAESRMLYGSDWPLQSFPLVWPWWLLGEAPLAELRYAAGLANRLDRDIALKAAIGVPAGVFVRTSDVLAVPGKFAE